MVSVLAIRAHGSWFHPLQLGEDLGFPWNNILLSSQRYERNIPWKREPSSCNVETPMMERSKAEEPKPWIGVDGLPRDDPSSERQPSH